MIENDPNLVQIEDRKLVRDMRSKAILNVDRSARAAYMKRRALRTKKTSELSNLKREAVTNQNEIAELRAQIQALSKLVQDKPTTKKKSTRRKKSETS